MTSPVARVQRETFTLESAEGLPIRGVLELPERIEGAVVMLHGFKGFRDWGFFPWLANYFAEAGLAVCRFDFSRNGMSRDGIDVFDRLDLFENDTYSVQLDDLDVVLQHVVRHPLLDDADISLFGYSRGGGVALLGATEVPRLRSIVTWSAISHVDRFDDETIRQWNTTGYSVAVNARTRQEMRVSRRIYDDYLANRARLDVLESVRALEVPLLVVHGEKDETVGVAEAKRIAEANVHSALLVLRNATHTFCAIHPLIHVPRELALAADVTARFLGV